MKKITGLIMCLMLLSTIFAGPVYAQDSVSPSSNVKANDSTISPQWINIFEVDATLSVRSGPGTSYSVIGTLPQGYVGSLYSAEEISANGYTWVPIYNSGHTAFWGWIAKDYITMIG